MLKLILITVGIWTAACCGFVGLRLWIAKHGETRRTGGASDLDLA